MNPLANKAMLVRLSVHSWYGRKIDRKAAAAAAASLQIDGGTDEYYKYLVPKTAFKWINECVTRMRAYHHWATFPWFDDGLRVLPGKSFFDYRTRITEFKQEFEGAVDLFINDYESYKQFAQANRQAIFDPKDYPTPDELRNMFRIETNFMPVPDGDFRLDLDPATLAELKQAALADQQRVVEENTKELLVQLQTRILQMQKMCETQPTRIFDATVARLVDCCEMARALNITNDGRLAAIVGACLTQMGNIDPDILRVDPQARARVSATCKDILELFL